VSFNQSTYSVVEHEGPVQPILVLSKPSPCCLQLSVKIMNKTATGELCMYVVYIDRAKITCFFNPLYCFSLAIILYACKCVFSQHACT